MKQLAAALSIVVLLAAAAKADDELVPPTAEEAADIQKWIPEYCCRTRNCCVKVPASTLIPHPDDLIEVRATGQKLKRTGWSQDKNTWRCTCRFITGQGYVVSNDSPTYCVFPHLNGY